MLEETSYCIWRLEKEKMIDEGRIRSLHCLGYPCLTPSSTAWREILRERIEEVAQHCTRIHHETPFSVSPSFRQDFNASDSWKILTYPFPHGLIQHQVLCLFNRYHRLTTEDQGTRHTDLSIKMISTDSKLGLHQHFHVIFLPKQGKTNKNSSGIFNSSRKKITECICYITIHYIQQIFIKMNKLWGIEAPIFKICYRVTQQKNSVG